jgi:CubicO group peptidase (beta-lactamase class C family)
MQIIHASKEMHMKLFRQEKSTVLTILFTATLFLLNSGTAEAKPRRLPPPDIDAYVARVMKVFEVPGIALAVVKDGQVILARGFGVKKLGSAEKTDAQTLFAIASNTKLFTAVAIGLLVEEGRLAWDAPVIDYMPGFCMWDPFVTRELTVRDLLVHRSGLGLGAGDLLWWPPSTYTRKEIFRRLRFIKPATSFRSAYAYDNVLYLAAGELIEAVSGKTWEEFVAERILRRLGMSSTTVHLSATGQGGNEAWPHARIDKVVRPVAPFANDNTDPAGGIRSSAEDISKWLLLHLNNGKLVNSTRLFSEQTAQQLTTLVTPIPIPTLAAELVSLKANFRGYALGLVVQDYRGHLVHTHTGGLPGYLSRITLLPELRLGIAVLTNQESGDAFNAITWHILDHYLNAPAADWIEAFRKVGVREEEESSAALKKSAAVRASGSQPSLPLEKYCGLYRDSWYGDITIAMENGKAVMRFSHTPGMVGDLEHWQHDTFIARWRDRELRADAYVTFALNPDGSIDQARMSPVSPETDFSFDFSDLLLKPAGK